MRLNCMLRIGQKEIDESPFPTTVEGDMVLTSAILWKILWHRRSGRPALRGNGLAEWMSGLIVGRFVRLLRLLMWMN